MKKQRAKAGSEKSPAETVLVDEGRMTLRLKSEGQADRVLNLDLVPLRMACEKCEVEHKLKDVNGFFVPTARFLASLAKEFSTVAGCSISETVAYQLWPVVNARWVELKKNMSETRS